MREENRDKETESFIKPLHTGINTTHGDAFIACV